MKLAQSYGIEAVRVTAVEEVQPALEKCFAKNEPFLIDFCTEEFEVV